MDKEYWQKKWKSGDVNFDRLDANPLLTRFINDLSFSQNARILVPLCGRSIDMQWLLSQGFSVVGVELYEEACRQFFRMHALPFCQLREDKFNIFVGERLKIYAGDFFELTPPLLQDIDGIYDRAALIALPESQRKSYAKKIIDLSRPGTEMLLITTVYDQKQMAGPPFCVNEKEINDLYGDGFSLHTLLYEPIEVSDHLRKKGLNSAHDLVIKGVRK